MIVTTNRNYESLKPLFEIADSDTELIITDSKYNENTKKWLGKQVGKYEKIIYAPIKQSSFNYLRNFSQGLNTALLLSENGWIVRADDNLEFKPDFFKTIRDDINSLTDVVGGEKFAIIGQKLWNSLGHKKWNDYYNVNVPSRIIPVDNPSFTFSFGAYPIDLIYALNAYDERYDIGFGYDDIQFLHRTLASGYKVFYDRSLMAFSHKKKVQSHAILPTKTLYEYELPELNAGKTHAYNPFNFMQMQNSLLVKREDYFIK